MARSSCTFCGRSGHTQSRCFRAHPELAPACSNCHKRGHTESRCWTARPEVAPAQAPEEWLPPTQAEIDEIIKSVARLATEDDHATGDIKPVTVATFHLSELPTEEVLQTIRKWDVRTVAQALDGSRIATCTILRDHIESLPHFQKFEENRKQIFQNFKDIEGLQRAVDKARDFARWSLLPDIKNWTYDNVMNNYTEALCPRCLEHPGKQCLNATDGMTVCYGCFLENPSYRLALNVEAMKDVRTDTDMYGRPSVGWAKDYLTAKKQRSRPLVCSHGKNIVNTQEIQLCREGGSTWASIGKKLWVKVIPYYDKRLGFDWRDEEDFYSAEGCYKHPGAAYGDPTPRLDAYDPDEL